MVENLNMSKFLDEYSSSIDYESIAMTAEFKLAINSYLKELVVSPVRSLKDLIAFNNKFSNLVSVSAINIYIYIYIYTVTFTNAFIQHFV